MSNDINYWDQTPDLSTSYSPVPKPLKRVKIPKNMKTEGKKTIAWTDECKKLVLKFKEMGIIKCEIHFKDCQKDNMLGFAHLEKRRKLKPEDLGEVVLACTNCHNMVEYWPAAKMKEYLSLIIQKRKITK